MNGWPKCSSCDAPLVVGGYYSIGYCSAGCGDLDVCLIHDAPIFAKQEGEPRECQKCRVIRIRKEALIDEANARG
jgi:hypothetical protein